MPLRLRLILTGLAVLVLAAIGAALALAWRETQWVEQQHTRAAATPALLWQTASHVFRQTMATQLDALQPLLSTTRDERLPTTLAERAGSAALQQIDLYDATRRLQASSHTPSTPLLDTVAMLRLGHAGQLIWGVSLPDRDRALLVQARRLPDGRVLAVAVPLQPAVEVMAAALGVPLVLHTLRGRALQPGLAAPAAGNGADNGADSGADTAAMAWLVLPGVNGNPAAALHAATVIGPSVPPLGSRLAWSLGAGVLLLGAVSVWAVHRLMSPVLRGVALTEALAEGRLQACADDDDQLLPGEAGRLARAGERVRTELRSLGALREERLRVAQQQERLMREQLRGLADTLDPSARDEVLGQLALNDAADGEPQLARLASLMARMSTLVGDQQNRLLKLLRELQASVKSREMLASLQQELQIARDMQRSILPRGEPPTRAVALQATMQPAREVGGDFYDWFMLDPHRLALVVADVSGKGVPAAFFMAITRTLLRASAAFLADPAATIARLNEQLAADNEQTMFVTLIYGVLDLRSGRFEFVNAGHNPALVRRAGVEGVAGIEWLASGRNPAVAAMAGVTFKWDVSTLQPGDGLLLYTDGITEATNGDGALFGEAALAAQLARGDAEPVMPLVRAVRQFEAGAAQSDDITCVWLRFEGAVESA
jgi:phosphoserine phosphatase RsbU/P